MRRAAPVAILLVAAVVVVGVLSGRGRLDNKHRATGYFSGDKVIAFDLRYGGNALDIAVRAYADVADRTAATVELTGPQHWRCQGQFRVHSGDAVNFPWDMEILPYFVPSGAPSDAPGVSFFVPEGSYAVTVRIPAVHAELKESAALQRGSGPNPQTLLYVHDPGCVLIADTAAQQKALITQYLNGMQLTAKRLGKPDLRTLVDQARQENASANQSSDPTVVQSRYARIARVLLNIADAVRAEFPDPPADLMQAITDTMPLLSQSGLR